MTEIPNWDEMAGAIVQYFSDGETHVFKEVHDHLADFFCLSDEQVQEKTEYSKATPLFTSRINLANNYLTKAGLLHRKSPGVYRITERGIEVSYLKLLRVDMEFLRQYPEFITTMKYKNNSYKQKEGVEIATPVTDSHLAEYRDIAIEKAAELLVEVATSYPGLLAEILPTMIRAIDEQNSGFVLELIKRCNKELTDNQPNYSEGEPTLPF